MATARMVVFKDANDKKSDKHFGIVLNNKSLLCMCCGGMMKAKEYKIVQEFDMDWAAIDGALKQMYDVA